MARGRLTFGVETSATYVDASHPETEIVAGTPRDVRHDQQIFLSELRVGVEYGFSDRVALAITFPLRVVDTGITYLDASTGDEVTVDQEIHHRDETLAGPGDPQISARAAFSLGDFVLDGRIGVTLPLGKTEEDPFALGEMGLEHQHIQFGTGTFNPILALSISRPFRRWSLTAWGSSQWGLYANDKGYRPGHRFGGGVQAASPLGTDRWLFRAGVEVQREDAERWSGALHTEGNVGRTDLLVGAGVGLALGRRAVVYGDARVPIVSQVEAAQMDVPVIVTLGIEVAWEKAKPPAPHVHAGDDHDHDHRDGEHEPERDPAHDDSAIDWTGVDMQHVNRPGEAVELVPVAGKLTVFDFWAAWCQPCKVLDRELIALAKRHPDRIAIRKVDIVDWESEASRRYLAPGSYDLPHVKVFGPDGALLVERSAGPLVLSRAIEEILVPPPAP